MSADPDSGAEPIQARAGDGGTLHVDARQAVGVQVGPDNTQIIYNYSQRTWADGAALPPLASVSGKVDSPYRGLRAFEERDAPFFFGREAAAGDVLKRMSKCADGTGLLVVSGVSGAGKSSLLRAGVLPQIRGAGLAAAPEAARWPCLLLTPGPAPLDVLAVQVAHLAGVDAAALRRGLDADPGRFALTARQAALAQLGGSPGDPGSLRRVHRTRNGCCWWSTSSSRCSPSALTRSSSRRSSRPCARLRPGTALDRIRQP